MDVGVFQMIDCFLDISLGLDFVFVVRMGFGRRYQIWRNSFGAGFRTGDTECFTEVDKLGVFKGFVKLVDLGILEI